MAKGADYNGNVTERKSMPDIDGSAPTEDLKNVQQNVFQSRVDNLSTLKSTKIKRPGSIRFNPVMAAIIVGAVAVVVIIVAVIIKNVNSGLVNAATPDEATVVDTTVAPTTEQKDLFSESEQMVSSALTVTTVPPTTQTTTTQPIHKAKADDTQKSKSSEKPEDSQKESSGKESENRSSDSRSDSGSDNSSGGSNHANQQQESYIGGEPFVSYNDSSYYNAKNNEVSSVKLSYSSKTMSVGDTLQLRATVSPSTANQSLSWSTSNSSVVSVSNGYLIALRSGAATITASAVNGKSASCEVRVAESDNSVDVHLSATEYNLLTGQTITITLFGTNNVSWDMNNNLPYIVSHSGNQITLRARSAGTTKITAKDNNTGKIYTCTFRVN